MLHRIDIHIEVPRVDYEKLSSDRLGESSASIRKRVQAAKKQQHIGYLLKLGRDAARLPFKPIFQAFFN
jgi:predicted ATPase with chaperone activity